MKNTIMTSIFETAATLPNIEGVAAINQLLTEACDQYEGTEPAGYSFSENILNGKSWPTFFLHTKIDKWPLEDKLFCGHGRTPEEAFEKLTANMNEWFQPLVCIEVTKTEKAA